MTFFMNLLIKLIFKILYISLKISMFKHIFYIKNINKKYIINYLLIINNLKIFIK